MRDENRIREKIEVSLDNRQVVSLVIASLVVMGVVFVLGVMVGKQLQPQGEAGPKDLLGALDNKVVVDAGSVALTFQHDLTQPSPAPPVLAVAPKPAERPVIKLDAKAIEPKPPPTPKLEAKVDAKPEPKPDDAKPDDPDDPDAPEVAVAPKPAPVAPPKPADAPAPSMDRKLADAFTSAKKEPATSTVPAPTSGFTVQVAASQQKNEVDAVLSKLRGSGLRPYLAEAEIPGKGHWYRVRLGTFKSKDDAEKYVRDLKRETGYSAFVTAAK